MIDPTQNGQLPQGTPTPTNQQAITSQQEYFDAFKAQGMGDKEVMELMGALGFDAESSYNMIVSDYEEQRRQIVEERERTQQLLDEQKKAYEDLLKKKDSPFEQAGGSFEYGGLGTPETKADPRVYQLRQNDELISKSVSQTNFGSLLSKAAAEGSNEEITKLLEQAQRSGLLPEFELEDEYSENTRNNLSSRASEIFSEGKLGYETALRNANDLNAQLGVNQTYNPYSDSDFKMLMMESFNRTLAEEEQNDREVDLFIRSKLGVPEEEGFFDVLSTDFKTNMQKAIYGMAVFQAENYGSPLYTNGNSFETAQYYKDRTRRADLEKQETVNSFYTSNGVSEKAYNAGLSERIGMLFDGEISARDFAFTSAVETARVMSDATRTFVEVMAFKGVPLAIDIFGNNYGQVRTYSPHISKESAIGTSAAKSAAEFLVERLTVGLGVGAEGLASTSMKRIGKRGALEAAKREIASEAAKASLKKTILKNTAAEGLEEAIVEVANWSIDAVDAIANGRNVKDLNPWQVVDSFMAGMAGGVGLVSLGAYASNQGHSKYMKRRTETLKELSALNKKIEAETNPDIREVYENKRTELMGALKILTKKESALYDSLNDSDKSKVLRYNQDITNLKQILTEGKYWDGSKVTKQERKQLEERLGAVLEAKVNIEKQAEEAQIREASEQEAAAPELVPNASEESVPVDTKVVTKEETKSHERIPEATESAPADQQQEEGQLSMFDENTMDSMVVTEEKKAEETPVSEEAPAAEEAPAVEETEQEDVYEVNVAEGQKIDLADTEMVGDGPNQISIPVASAINKMTSAFGGMLKKLGTKVKYHKTDASFATISPEMKATMKALTDKNGAIYGYYDKATNTIHLNNNTETIDAFEEFGHAVLEGVIGKDAESRQILFEEMQRIAKGKTKGAEAVAKILENTKKFYENRDEATQQEEAIISVLVNYANNPDEFITVKDKIRAAFNRLFKGLGVKKNVIKGDEGLFELADKFRRAALGQETQVEAEVAVAEEAPVAEAPVERPAEPEAKKPTETEEEYRARLQAEADAMLAGAEGIATPETDILEQGAEDIDAFQGRMSVRQKKEFNYLKDTEVFYKYNPFMGAGEFPQTGGRYSTPFTERSIKVNDYFHFRNWYNKQTGNQRASTVWGMYFIKDGKKYTVKPPKPKVDKDGSAVYMPIPINPAQKKLYREQIEGKSDMEMRQATSDLRAEAQGILNTIPWKASVLNVLDFQPVLPDEASTQQKYEAAVIGLKNVKAAKDLGLTAEAVKQRIQESQGKEYGTLDRVRDEDLLNPTGMNPFDSSATGDTVGMFSFRERKDLGAPDHIMSEEEMSDFIEGSLDELQGIKVLVFGYDRTAPSEEKAISSGIRAVMDLEDGDSTVISTHVSLRHARKVVERFRKKAEKIYDKTKETSGTFAVGFSILKPEATKGNPDVLNSFIRGLVARSRDKEAGVSGPTMYKFFNESAKPHIRTLVQRAEEDGFEGLSEDTAYLFSSSFDLPVTTQKQFEEIMDVVMNYNKFLFNQFEARKNFFSKRLVEEFFAHEKFDLGREIPSGSLTIDQQLSEYFNDPVLERQVPATLIGFKKFKYIIDQDVLNSTGQVKLKNIKAKSLPGYGFGGALVAEDEGGIATVEPMKILREQYTLDKIDPDFIAQAKPSKRNRQKEFDEARTPYEKAEQINRWSQYEINADANDVDGRASIREVRGLASARTDQGTWQLSDMSSWQMWRNKWIKRLQDKYVDIFKLQEDVEKTRGVRRQDQDFRMAEELMYGKAAEDLAKLDKKVDAITEEMKEKGLSVEDVSSYLYALHAAERNALIAERTEGETEAGSGMTNERAQEIIDSLSGKKDALDSVVKKIREIQQDTRDTMVEFGLETKETIDAFETMFENYVPLSGIAIDEETSVTSAYPTGGAGLSVFGPTTKRAEGRQSEATNVLAQIIAQNSSVHIKARTNEALQSLYNLVKENPNKNVWQILSAENVNSKDPHIVSVRVNGEQKFIKFKDASYAETLRNMNLPQTSVFVRMLRAPSNWLRRSFTTLNPEFMISNFSRDIQAAIFNAAAEADIEGGIVEGNEIVADMIKKVPATLKALLKAESPGAIAKIFKENPEIERYYQDFKDDGGKTGWSYAKPLEQIVSELEGKAGEKTRAQQLLGNAENFAKYIEGVNDAFENSIRLSAYIAAREKGVSREKAAQMAKNITVNFNKSGEYGQLLNSVYLFFNASVQGTARLGKSLLTMKPPTKPDGSKREWYNRFNNAQKMAAALTVFSGMSTMLALAMSDEDEDGELYYNKIPDYVKERNLIFMRRDGKNYYKIPLPYGFSLFANLGSTAVEVGGGHKEVDQAMMQLTASFINSFSPISFGQSSDLFTKAGKSIVPTVFKPLVDIMTNETYFGGPVYTENLPYGLQKPESSMSFRSPESIQQFFRWMNEATGGSVEVKGDLDFNPDKMWYLFEYFIGGAGKFVTRTGEAARRLSAKVEDNDVKIEANDIPFLRILYGEPSKYMDMQDYRERKQEVQQLYKELKASPRLDKPERYKGIVGLNKVLENYEKSLKAIRNAKRAALEIEDYTQRMVRIQELQDKERRIVMAFNKYYEQYRK